LGTLLQFESKTIREYLWNEKDTDSQKKKSKKALQTAVSFEYCHFDEYGKLWSTNGED